MEKKRNGNIGLLKFLFCLMVICLHTNSLAKNNEFILFKTGNIAVEFFFIVSGYFLAQRALKEKYNKTNIGKETIQFIWKKIKSFAPYLLLAFIVELTLRIIFTDISLYQLANSIWNLLLLQVAGFNKYIINIPIWYLSAMLISMAILYPIIKKYKYNYIYLFSPLIVILGLGWLFHDYTSLYSPFTWIFLISKGLLVGFITLNIGAIIYCLNECFIKIKFTKVAKALLTLFEVLGYSFIFLVSFFVERASMYSFHLLLLLIPLILISLSGHTLGQKYLSNSFVYYLERLSLPMYICHHMFVQIVYYFRFFENFSYYTNAFIVIGTTIVVSIILMKLVTKLEKNNYYLDKIKKIFIEE